jgi:hypothetical protein
MDNNFNWTAGQRRFFMGGSKHSFHNLLHPCNGHGFGDSSTESVSYIQLIHDSCGSAPTTAPSACFDDIDFFPCWRRELGSRLDSQYPI